MSQAQAQIRVLVFEEDEENARHLKKLLQGCETVLETSLYQATRRFKNAPFDLSIISLDMPDEEGEELAWWLLENFPRRQVILTGSEVLPEQEDLLAYKSVVGFFPSPLPASVISGVLGQSDRGLRGQVQRMQVSDLLKALRYSQKAIILQFEDATLQQEGWVYMQNADIVHVEVYQRNPITRSRTLLAKGTEAFDLMMEFKNGAFSEQIWQEPPERSVMIPFDGLMMNAAQKRDENMWTQEDGIRIRKALLIDNEAMSRMMLQQGLLAEGIDCVSLRSLDQVSSSLVAQESELLIIDADLDKDEIIKTLKWVKTRGSGCRVLLLGNPYWEDPLPMPCQILPRPISPKRLKEILFELTQVGFRGYLSRIGVLDFLQLNLSAIDESKKLHIRDLSNRVDGQIYIDRGRFIHAEFGDLEGEEAFFRIAAIDKGDFFEDPSFHPPAQTLAEIMPHKLMINAGRFAKPLEEPDPVLSVDSHLEGVSAKMNEVADTSAAGSLNLFGDDDLSEISLNLGSLGGPGGSFGAETANGGGVTNLFGDDEAGEISFGFAQPVETGSITSLFGDDEGEEIKLNLGAALGGAPTLPAHEAAGGGITSLFGDDDDDIKLNLGAAFGNPAASLSEASAPTDGMTSLFGDDELDEIQFGFGQQLATAGAEDAVPVPPAPAPSAVPEKPAASAKIEEMRARWAERRAAISTGRTGPLRSPGRTGPLGSISNLPAPPKPGDKPVW